MTLLREIYGVGDIHVLADNDMNWVENSEDIQAFGVEVELENIRFQHDEDDNDDADDHVRNINGWSISNDGSLRNNGAEFVSSPFTLDAMNALFGNLDDFLDKLRKHNEPDPSSRCGVHVHVDCSFKTKKDLFNILVAYMILEPALFRVSGNRVNSNFCVPLNKINGAYSSILRARRLDYVEAAQNLRAVFKKYSALNCSTLNSLGTIEFRMHKATAKIKEDLADWVLCISNLFNIANRYGNKQKGIVKTLSELNNNSEYFAILSELFSGTKFSDVADDEILQREIRSNVTILKLSAIQ